MSNESKDQKNISKSTPPSHGIKDEFENVEVVTGTDEQKEHVPFAGQRDRLQHVTEQSIGTSDPDDRNDEP